MDFARLQSSIGRWKVADHRAPFNGITGQRQLPETASVIRHHLRDQKSLAEITSSVHAEPGELSPDLEPDLRDSGLKRLTRSVGVRRWSGRVSPTDATDSGHHTGPP